MKDLRKPNTCWAGSEDEQNISKFHIVLDNRRVWNCHIDHVRIDHMDREVLEPSRVSQDKPPQVPLVVPLSMSVSNPSFTYLLTYLLTYRHPQSSMSKQGK